MLDILMGLDLSWTSLPAESRSYKRGRAAMVLLLVLSAACGPVEHDEVPTLSCNDDGTIRVATSGSLSSVEDDPPRCVLTVDDREATVILAQECDDMYGCAWTASLGPLPSGITCDDLDEIDAMCTFMQPFK